MYSARGVAFNQTYRAAYAADPGRCARRARTLGGVQFSRTSDRSVHSGSHESANPTTCAHVNQRPPPPKLPAYLSTLRTACHISHTHTIARARVRVHTQSHTALAPRTTRGTAHTHIPLPLPHPNPIPTLVRVDAASQGRGIARQVGYRCRCRYRYRCRDRDTCAPTAMQAGFARTWTKVKLSLYISSSRFPLADEYFPVECGLCLMLHSLGHYGAPNAADDAQCRRRAAALNS